MSFGLLGFECDEGVRRNNGRPGAADGPKAFREALEKINWHTSTQPPFTDFGNISCEPGDLESAQTALGTKVFEILSQQKTPVLIGGGHEIAWGHFQGISKFLGKKNCGIINFDAHFDLRPLLQNKLGTSGTPFLQIAHERQAKNLAFDYLVLGLQAFSNSDALFKQGQDLKVSYVLAENLEQEAPEQISAILKRHDHIYLTICLDVFAESAAPGVSAPQALGLFPGQILPLLKQIKQSNKLVAIDIAELAPHYDRQETTAKLAANLMAYLIS
ncbi:MAG: formimidoylglutamase [Myxococcaceae bacterium]